MESWSYVDGGKGFVCDDSVSENDGIAKSSKNGLMGCELKSSWSYGCTMMCSSQEGVENQQFVDLASSDMVRKSLANDSIGDVLAGKISNSIEIGTVTAPLNAFPGGDESSSKLSSSIVESNCRDSSLIDLKLGRLNDHRDAKNFSSFEATRNLSPGESWIPAKRARAGGVSSQTPYCQVHGCKKDLSSSKDYHKRHKVCEIHSKTPKVIVNGIEQRFCQQCSRFHLLDEFDDGKRSCRKRLAGHNERRRKPHMRMHDGRAGRLFQSFNATRFQGNAFSASSFVCQDILPSSFLHSEKYEISDSSRIVKVEGGADLSPYLSNPFTNGLVTLKSLFGSHDSEKQCPSLQDDGISTITRRKINENSLYIQDMADSDFVSHSMFHNSSVGNGDMTVLDSSSTIQGLSESHSGGALSLLSSQSQNSTNHSAGVPTALPLITSGSRALYPVTPEKLLGVSSQAPSTMISTAFHSSLMNSSEENRLDPILISVGSAAANSGIDRIIQGSEYVNSKNSFSCENGPTINLLELSSQLQRVENQRQSMLVKEENDAFSDLRIT